MSRYVEIDDVFHALVESHCAMPNIKKMQEVFDSVPTADVVEVVHGVWLEDSDGNLICSKCKFKFYPIMFNFCPNCGADMRLKGGAE